jgi:hypothetical protein
MSSTRNQSVDALGVTHPGEDKRGGKSGIFVPAYVIAVVVAMIGWLYLLSNAVMIFIWKFTGLAAYVLFE